MGPGGGGGGQGRGERKELKIETKGGTKEEGNGMEGEENVVTPTAIINMFREEGAVGEEGEADY